jgi:hypothetical protein
MLIKYIARGLVLSACILVLAGCETSFGMSQRTLEYNEAVADSTNQFFLISALRAKDRFPLYYTRTTGNNAVTSVTPSVTASLSNEKLTPSVTVGGSIQNQLSLANLDDQKFMRGVLTPVPLTVLESYFGQGWPEEVLLMMFIKKIVITPSMATTLAQKFDAHCTSTDQNGKYCANKRPKGTDAPSATVTSCLSNSEIAPKGQDAVFDNYPMSSESLNCLQGLLKVLLGLGFQPVDATKYTVLVPDLPPARAGDLKGLGDAITAKLAIAQRTVTVRSRMGRVERLSVYAVCTKKDITGFTLNEAVFSEAATPVASTPEPSEDLERGTSSLIGPMPKDCAEQVEAARKAQIDKIDKKASTTFTVTTRSLDSMLYYLGEVLRAKNVNVWMKGDDDQFVSVPLFVVQEETGSERAFVRTTYRGKDYAIPETCGAGKKYCEGRSLQVLSLLNQIWGLQKEATEAPTIPTVSVINSH